MKKLLMSLAVILIGGILFVGVAGAQTIRSGDVASISTDEVVDSSAYLAGSSVDVAGTVNGDVFCAGQTIIISGTVEGDVLCAAQTITITGTVAGDIRLAAQSITLSGKVGRNATLAGQSVAISSDGQIGGDVTGGVATLTVSTDAEIGRDLLVGAQTITVDGSIGRNIKSGVENITIGNSGSVGGDIEYTSDNNIKLLANAQVAGTTKRIDPPKDNRSGNGIGIAFTFSTIFLIYLMLIFTSLVFVLVFPSFLRESYKRTAAAFGSTLIHGVVFAIVMPVLITILFITVLGIPIGFLSISLWCIVLTLSGPFFAFYVGQLLLPQQRNSVIVMLVGSAVVYITYFIPIIGVFTVLAALLIGSGMVVKALLSQLPKPVYSLQKASKK